MTYIRTCCTCVSERHISERYDEKPPIMNPPKKNFPKIQDLNTRRKQLLFRSEHRGMREMDMILSTFGRQYLGQLDAEGLDCYEVLLKYGDNDLYAWISGQEDVPEAYRTRVLDLFVNHKLDFLKT